MENKQKSKYEYLGSNIAIIIGIVSFLGITDIILFSLGAYGKNLIDLPDFGGAGLTGYGIYIILSALLFKSVKKQKYNPSKVWRIVELSAFSIFILVIIILFNVGVGNIIDNLTNPNVTLEYKIPLYIYMIVTIWTIISYPLIKFKKLKIDSV